MRQKQLTLSLDKKIMINVIIEDVLKNIKKGTPTSLPVTSLNDILSFSSLPFYYANKSDEYIKQYGENKIQHYVSHNDMLDRVRVQSFKEVKQMTNIISPEFTQKLAITLCGFGECEETTSRAAIDLILRFNAVNCNVPIFMFYVLGKQKIHPSSPSRVDRFDIHEHYNHAFLIIGQLPEGFCSEPRTLLDLKGLSDDCILLDPSLEIIGKANQINTLLESFFHVYGIDRLYSDTVEYLPSRNAEGAIAIYDNATKMANLIRSKLHTSPYKIVPFKPWVVPSLKEGQITLFAANRSSDKLLELTQGEEAFLEGYHQLNAS